MAQRNTGKSWAASSLLPIGLGAIAGGHGSRLALDDFAYSGDGQRDIVHSDELLTAFSELEAMLL